MPTFKVRLNGTYINPYHKLGLTRNPFPQVGRAEYQRINSALATIAAEPCPNLSDLEALLERLGAEEEFRKVCRQNYKAGEEVEFAISFPD